MKLPVPVLLVATDVSFDPNKDAPPLWSDWWQVEDEVSLRHALSEQAARRGLPFRISLGVGDLNGLSREAEYSWVVDAVPSDLDISRLLQTFLVSGGDWFQSQALFGWAALDAAVALVQPPFDQVVSLSEAIEKAVRDGAPVVGWPWWMFRGKQDYTLFVQGQWYEFRHAVPRGTEQGREVQG